MLGSSQAFLRMYAESQRSEIGVNGFDCVTLASAPCNSVCIDIIDTGPIGGQNRRDHGIGIGFTGPIEVLETAIASVVTAGFLDL